jgi:hypothetical protein
MALTSEEKADLDAVASYIDEILEDGVSDQSGNVVIAAIPQYVGADPTVRASVRSVYLATALAMRRAGMTS